MFTGKYSFIRNASFLTGILILLITLSLPSTAYADDPTSIPPDDGNCINCHEDLYFLHDTGNWFCLKESPMACVDCHGGDPTATTKELAHINRAPHPILNDDVTKCMECHPEQCDERVEIFDETAGISNVLVAVPYIPMPPAETSVIPVTGQQSEQTAAWLNLMEIISVILIGSIALVIYLYYRAKHTS